MSYCMTMRTIHIVYFLRFAFLFCNSTFCFRFQAVAAEKAHISLITGVEHFDKASMRHAETEEKNALPPIEGIFACVLLVNCVLLNCFWFGEKIGFKENSFNRFISFSAIQQEKSQVELIEGIEGFQRTSLKHAETQEKNPLPTKETIDQEKAA